MKIAGIVCEFNPFHHGHKYLIDKIKNDYKMDLVIAAMSPNFVMRGEPAIFNKFERTYHALLNRVDLVAEIPTVYAIESADIFAYRSIEILNNLGITDLFFGVEVDDASTFDRIIEISESKKYLENIKKYLEKGDSFNAASKKSIIEIDPQTSIILSSPNNLLAIEYLKSIKKINNKIIPHFIKRVSTFYYDSLKEGTIIQSGTAIRELIKENKEYKNFVPYETKRVVYNVNNTLFELIKYKIISSSCEEIANIKGVTEGLENKIKSIKEFTTYENLIAELVSKRNRETKIKRILMYILLGIKKCEASSSSLKYIRILGFSSAGQKYLSFFNNENIKIYTSLKKSPFEALSNELTYTKIYSMLTHEDIIEKEYLPIRLS